MKESNKFFLILIFLFSSLCLFSACSLNKTREIPELTSIPSETSDLVPSSEPTFTEEPYETVAEAATFTATCLETSTPTPTNTPKNTPTNTPLPTEIPDFVSEVDELSSDEHKAPVKTINCEPVEDLIFSEIISSNTKYSPLNSEYYDMIELYNASSAPINLSNYYLSDKKSETKLYNLPNITLNQGEYYIIYCTGNTSSASECSFKIGSDGEKLFLSKGDEIIDRVTIPSDLKQNYSYARYGETWVYAVIPTFGSSNSNGHTSQLRAPNSSVPSGVYESEITVELTGDGVIKYTLDGSKPNENSTIYRGAITISSTCSIRCYTVKNGETSAEESFTYIIDEGHTLPVVNISMPTDEFNWVSKNTSENNEAEALFTLIEDGVEKFSIACGFRLHGNDSRNGRKQNFSLRFRSIYGASKLNYKVFDNLEIDEFNSLLLKGGSEDFPNAIIRDVFCDSIVADSNNLYTQATKPVVLYISGEYWGIYFITEKIDESYVASHLGVSEDNMDIIKCWFENEAGSYNDYYNLVVYCKNHDLNVEEYYNYVNSICDIDDFIDWAIFRSFFGDHDNANWRCFKTYEGDDNRFHLTFFDMDWAMWKGVNEDTFSFIMGEEDDDVMQALAKSKIFQEKMMERINELSETVLSSSYLTEKIDYYVDLLEPEIERDQKRWKLDVENWYNQIEMLKKFVKDGNRMKYFKEQVVEYFEK